MEQLAISEQIDLRVIFARRLVPDRMNLGWRAAPQDYPHHTLSRESILEAVGIARKQRSRLHIVNGIWAEPAFSAALVALTLARARFVIHAEAPDPFEPRSWVKRLMRNSFGKLVAHRASGILAISDLAVDYYTQLGFKDEFIYPFGYFKSNSRHAGVLEAGSNDTQTEIVFVGQLIRRKGVDILIDAITPLFGEYSNLRLSLVGIGAEGEALREQVREQSIADRVRFEGVLPADCIESRISQADLLVLPSRWDGWGMTVNEALAVGVPVIASDRCGAADLLHHGVNGYIFRVGDTAHLRECIVSFLRRRQDWPRFRAAALATGNCISAEKVAPYLVNCLKHVTGKIRNRPRPPWVQLGVCEPTA